MLNQLIARFVKDALKPMHGPVISRLAGLVRTLETDAFTKGKVSRFPIAIEQDLASCSSSGKVFPDLVPDQSERLIVYVEETAPATLNGKRWTSRLRLVGWGNADLIQTDRPAYLTPTLLVAILIGKLKNVSGESPIGSLKCEVTGQPLSGPGLFSAYSYSEVRSQYLLPPYFSFALNLELTYTLDHDCLPQLTGLPADGC